MIFWPKFAETVTKKAKNMQRDVKKEVYAQNFSDFRLPSVHELVKRAEKYNLWHLHSLQQIPEDRLLDDYNGVGPDRWPEWLRNAVSWLLQDILEAVIIHDEDYTIGGNYADFLEANAVLADNICILAKKKYGFWRIRRYFLLALAPQIEQLTNRYGWVGWNSMDSVKNNATEDKNDGMAQA